ncbi:hypothetical protein ROS217_14891 [Roseovarius sp. 217]|nr:hypothetical protein ROS217_14891 [Roseovarius sp. 217]
MEGWPQKFGPFVKVDRMIDRLWRSLKYECVYLRAFEIG